MSLSDPIHPIRGLDGHPADGAPPLDPGHAASSPSAILADDVLWDVLEEHLDEAEFGIERFEDALESPVLTLKELAAGVESRLLAHLDALKVGGAAAIERVLAPVLKAPEAVEAPRLTAASIAVVEGGRFELVQPVLAHEDAVVRRAAVRACELAEHPGLDAWLRHRLDSDVGIQERASLLAIVAGRGLATPTVLVEWLQGESVDAAKAASEAARLADPQRHLPVIEWLLGHQDEGLREAALVTAWIWRSPYAFRVCERWALGSSRPRILPMALYAALGSPAHSARLAEQLGRPSYRNAALFALGFSGQVTQLPVLAQFLDSDDALTAKIAAQAISMITGLDLGAERFALSAAARAEEGVGLPAPEQDPEAALALPPLDEDDLDADLVPAPESALPVPNPAAIRRFCEEATKALPPDGRYLGGRLLGPQTIVEYLESAPMRRRHFVALAFAIRTGGRAWVAARGFSGTQRRQTEALRAADWTMR
jgi:uncharacterized protein (TIGR02270 family)